MERKKMKFEILLDRFFSNFHRVLLTNLLFAVPSAVLFVVFYLLSSLIFKDIIIPFLMISIIPLFPFYAGVVAVCRNIARGDKDVPTYTTFVTAVKNNFLPFLLHGLIVYIASLFSFFSISLYGSMLSQGWFFYVLLFFSILITLFLLYIAFYVPLMNITYDIPLKYVYKNSFLMAFGELKNNLFATIALAVVAAICLTITAFSGTVTVLLIILAVLWVFILPATTAFMYIFFIYDGMASMIDSKSKPEAASDEEKESAVHHNKDMEDDFSDIDIDSLSDTDDYIFHNGRMVKQSTLLHILRDKQQNKAGEKHE
ncbi:DUF624 domain-containing protein [uncultured Ruminococcus sp.]|uniref:DUF624 domain-containing protein n=1 Tax=uncultured Ruminococcus sp. TaxID=165186 RepID=UPI00292CFEEA|nr:DUF624 domain-containing protein [uncultured Ruminococcus sp.]